MLHVLTLYLRLERLGRMMSWNMDRRVTGPHNGRVTPTQDRIHDKYIVSETERGSQLRVRIRTINEHSYP